MPSIAGNRPNGWFLNQKHETRQGGKGRLAGHSSQQKGYEEMLPKQPVQEWLSPIKQFLCLQSSSGILLLFYTAIALA
jgi:hypothetical protein